MPAAAVRGFGVGGRIVVTCPKCGYEQEQRLDCLKCGIVFTKYIGARNGDRPGMSASGDSLQGMLAAPSSATLSELRESIRDLNHRYREMEFERAERNRMREDLNGLDRRLSTALEPMTTRLESLEKHASELAAPEHALTLNDQPGLRDDIQTQCVEPLVHRLEQLESRLAKLEETVQNLARSQENDDTPRPPLEEDVHVIRQNLDQIRRFVSQLGPAS